ncbi:hypothetical protein PR048_020051 [Dryococelus australis]|uniref:HTH psq-type domain-containing protein n=1 Tax=Dryococelus australis TaxID=614101 RepID=A0ABQ9H5K6_9NEOP|nr:hypothetical protein PR048_020051 [Dryococelus australis]
MEQVEEVEEIEKVEQVEQVEQVEHINSKMPNKANAPYKKERLAADVFAVHNREKIRTAARNFGVPRLTLQHYLKRQSKSSFGPKPIFSNDEERRLVDWLLDLSKKGFPRRREYVQLGVQEFLNANERKTSLKDNLPGIGLSTPDMTPHLTLHLIPHLTPHLTPHMTPKLTPDLTLHMTPNLTPALTPHLNPHFTPHMTPNMTPNLTPYLHLT